MMTKHLFLLLFFFISLVGNAQKIDTATYYFDNDLKEVAEKYSSLLIITERGAYSPLLISDGQGGFSTDYISLTENLANVFNFKMYSGIRYSNQPKMNLRSYTIEMCFKLESIWGWIKIIDFKEMQTDRGLYVYDGGLDFYLTEETANKSLVKSNEYCHLIITRNDTTSKVRVYINGQLELFFDDSAEDAISINTLHFFQDDALQSGIGGEFMEEGANGSVAFLRIISDSITDEEAMRMSSSLKMNINSGKADVLIDESKIAVLNKLQNIIKNVERAEEEEEIIKEEEVDVKPIEPVEEETNYCQAYFC